MTTEQEPEPLGEDMPAQAYAVIDGPSLRELRKHYGVHLRHVAREAKMSHGHLSKVERGEPGREVTPAVLAAYEKTTGVRLADQGGPGGWQPGQLNPATLRAFASRVAAVAFGGAMHNLDRVLDSSGRLQLAEPLREEHIAPLQQIADQLTQLDGPIPGMAARTLLRWLVWFLEEPAADQGQPPTSVYAVVATLARRAGQAGEQLGAHEVARTLYLVALHASAVADHPELRALILADVAGQHHRLGHHQAAQAIARLGETDERIPDDARKLLYQVKAAAAEAEARVQEQLRQALADDNTR